ncbi:MAG: DUF3239 domain-containing protein [Thermoguttaceae bacterium]
MKTLDNSTRAAVPGELLISRKRYAEYFGRNPIDRSLRRFCSHLPWIARRLPVIGARVLHWTRTREHIWYGCLNPAVVLDSESGLVAVFTSLTARGETPTPVLKIVQERLDMISHCRATRGRRFAAASLYSSTRASWARGQWSDFSPIVVDCLVDDYASCEAAAARIKPLAWTALEIALRQFGGRRQPGLYPVDVPHDLVWNSF